MRKAFVDFTYYDNAMCAYSFTKYFMPFILSGQRYTYEEQLQGVHVSYQYNKDVEKIENGIYLGNMEVSITIVSTYIEKLKENNVYSIIIIMTDHGYSTKGLKEGKPRFYS